MVLCGIAVMTTMTVFLWLYPGSIFHPGKFSGSSSTSNLYILLVSLYICVTTIQYSYIVYSYAPQQIFLTLIPKGMLHFLLQLLGELLGLQLLGLLEVFTLFSIRCILFSDFLTFSAKALYTDSFFFVHLSKGSL